MLIRALGSQQETGGQGKSSWKGGQGGSDGGTRSSATAVLSLSQVLLAGVVFCSEGNVISCICGARKQRETRRGVLIPPPDRHSGTVGWGLGSPSWLRSAANKCRLWICFVPSSVGQHGLNFAWHLFTADFPQPAQCQQWSRLGEAGRRHAAASRELCTSRPVTALLWLTLSSALP